MDERDEKILSIAEKYDKRLEEIANEAMTALYDELEEVTRRDSAYLETCIVGTLTFELTYKDMDLSQCESD